MWGVPGAGREVISGPGQRQKPGRENNGKSLFAIIVAITGVSLADMFLAFFGIFRCFCHVLMPVTVFKVYFLDCVGRKMSSKVLNCSIFLKTFCSRV